MGDKRIEDYVRGINKLYKETGLLIDEDTFLYEVKEPNGPTKAIAEIRWDNENKEYYPRYIH